MTQKSKIQKISVIVPENPFVKGDLREKQHCLAALDVENLMEWWPGTPHLPNRDAKKVKEIQRFLDWKRVAQIAAYLLQKEILDAPAKLSRYFSDIYEPKKMEPGREWPPRISKVIGFQRSEYPTFSNVLLHINGANIALHKKSKIGDRIADLTFDPNSRGLLLSVIDGQHRINGAYLALKILQEEQPKEKWQIPAEIFLDLDEQGRPPQRQAQIFIDVNFHQKKVDKSLVADLFPTARGDRGPLDDKERAQDIGRRLMLETGPLVGMIQIPGIKFGVKDVVTLATLNAAIESTLNSMMSSGITGLSEQTEFLSQCLEAWLEAGNRKHDMEVSTDLDVDSVVYQGRVLVSFLALLPMCILVVKKTKAPIVSTKAKNELVEWLRNVMKRAGLIEGGKFISKNKFKEKGYLGSGGIGRFKDALWASAGGSKTVVKLKTEEISSMARENREWAIKKLGGYEIE